MNTTPDTVVLYNDTCPICSREMALCQRVAQQKGLDILFEPVNTQSAQKAGLDETQALKTFHIVHDGQVLAGVDAFQTLWTRLGWTRLARLLSFAPTRIVADTLYRKVLAPALFALHQNRTHRQKSQPKQR